MSVVLVFAMGGQAVYFMQSMHAMKQIDFVWLPPIQGVLEAISGLVSLNMEALGVGCYLPDNGPVSLFALQLLAFPSLVCVTLMQWLLAKLLRHPFPLETLFRVHCMLLVSLFTSITITLFKPFECRENPNGSSTVLDYPQIICWQSAEHRWLVMLAAAGILMYPVSTLAWLSHITFSYSKWLVSGRGIQMVERYRFLFGRFRPERYFYCLVLTVSNMIVGCTPALLVSYPALQIGVMSFVFWGRVVIHCMFWPWRPESANWSELVLLGAVSFLLNLAAPLLNQESRESAVILAYTMTVFICALPLVLLAGLSFLVWSKLQAQRRYKLFLCHHKATTGVLCRHLKLLFQKHVSVPVFYDSDNLRDLGELFDTVKMLTDNMLVVLTPELLQSMWCVSEALPAKARLDQPSFFKGIVARNVA